MDELEDLREYLTNIQFFTTMEAGSEVWIP